MQQRLNLFVLMSLVFFVIAAGALLAQQTNTSYQPNQPAPPSTATQPTQPATTSQPNQPESTTPPTQSTESIPPTQLNTTSATGTPQVTPPGTVHPAAPNMVTGEGLDLPVFGRNLFNNNDKSFEPNPDTPVPSNYQLGPGDTLAVLVYNGSDEYERSSNVITPNGDIYLKLAGTIPLAQRTLAQAEQDLRKHYAKYYTKFTLRVDVVGRRTIPIFVMGEVGKPGKYFISSLGTVFTALYAANGPTDIGSLRSIRLVRQQKSVTLDIYSYLLQGEVVDLPLQSGDTIFVSMSGKVVALAGEVRRPAKYELRDKDTLDDALRLAGGVSANSSAQIQLSRVGENHERQVLNLHLPADTAFPMKDGDIVYVGRVLPIVRNAVELKGEVNRPGPYPIEKAGTVGELMKLAEGVTPDAYLDQAIIERLGEDNTQRTQIPVNLRTILGGEANTDVKLQPRDILHVFNRNELSDLLDSVSIEGEVVKPNKYPYQPGLRISDLMQLAFGPTTEAYLQQAYIYRYPVGAQSQIVSVDLTKALIKDEKANLRLLPRDRLVVKSQQQVTALAINVDGEVANPHTLTYYDGIKISDAIFLCGGLKPNVALDHALLVRLNQETYAEELVEISLRKVLAHDGTQDLLLRNHDRLVVYPNTQMGNKQFVTIEGAVLSPGNYDFIGNMRVSHLLFLAKGLLQNAYAERADLYRLQPDNSINIIPVNLVDASTGLLTDTNPQLMPGDRLVISTRDQMEEPKLVKIDGYVRQPGNFELTMGLKLSDLLHLAGGLKPEADNTIDIYRMEGDKVSTISCKTTIVDGKPAFNIDPLLASNDLVSVRGNASFVKTTETITIDGEVNHPGAYPAYERTKQTPKTLYEILTKAGGILPDAYPAGIVLYRQQSALYTDRQQTALGNTMRDLDANVGIPMKPAANPAQPLPTPSSQPGSATASTPPATSSNTSTASSAATTSTTTPSSSTPSTTTPASGVDDANAKLAVPSTTSTTTLTPAQIAKAQSVENASASLAQVLMTDQGNSVVLVIPPRSMQTQQYSLSVPIDAEPILRSKGKRGDITLEPGDIVYVPKRPTTVSVLGGVVSNGSVVYQEGKKMDYYLTAVGGTSPDGEQSRTVIMRMNGLVVPQRLAKTIQPGDIIIVPTKHMLRVISTQGTIQNALRTLSELAISFLPFKK